MAIETVPEPALIVRAQRGFGLGFLTASPIIATATVCLTLVVLSAIFAPWLAPHDPMLLAPAQRLKPPSAEFMIGTDAYGRDLLSRILYGGRISLLIGLGAAVVSIAIGLAIGLVSGFFKWVDAVLMRIMDGLMAIPSILLAIAVVSLSGASLTTVLIAITIPEVPRVARLVRAVVLSARARIGNLARWYSSRVAVGEALVWPCFVVEAHELTSEPSEVSLVHDENVIEEPASRSLWCTWRASDLVWRAESALATMIQSKMGVMLRTSIAWMSRALMSSSAEITSFFLPGVVSFFIFGRVSMRPGVRGSGSRGGASARTRPPDPG